MPFLKSLVCHDLGLNPCPLYHWWTLYPLGQWAGTISNLSCSVRKKYIEQVLEATLHKAVAYWHLPPITKTIQGRRTRHAEHCWRNRDELINDVLLWTPSHERAKGGQPAWIYVRQLCVNTGLEDLLDAMDDSEGWRERVKDICTDNVTWWW